MLKFSHEILRNIVPWIFPAVILPALWAMFWLLDPATHRFLSDSSWMAVLVVEPIVAWWLILLLKSGRHWFERELAWPSDTPYRIARLLLWVNVLGLPPLLLYTSHGG